MSTVILSGKSIVCLSGWCAVFIIRARRRAALIMHSAFHKDWICYFHLPFTCTPKSDIFFPSNLMREVLKSGKNSTKPGFLWVFSLTGYFGTLMGCQNPTLNSSFFFWKWGTYMCYSQLRQSHDASTSLYFMKWDMGEKRTPGAEMHSRVWQKSSPSKLYPSKLISLLQRQSKHVTCPGTEQKAQQAIWGVK